MVRFRGFNLYIFLCYTIYYCKYLLWGIWGFGVKFLPCSLFLMPIAKTQFDIAIWLLIFFSLFFFLIYLVVDRLLLGIIFYGTHWVSAHLLLQRTFERWQHRNALCCDCPINQTQILHFKAWSKLSKRLIFHVQSKLHSEHKNPQSLLSQIRVEKEERKTICSQDAGVMIMRWLASRHF